MERSASAAMVPLVVGIFLASFWAAAITAASSVWAASVAFHLRRLVTVETLTLVQDFGLQRAEVSRDLHSAMVWPCILVSCGSSKRASRTCILWSEFILPFVSRTVTGLLFPSRE